MMEQEMRIAIAEACGIRVTPEGIYIDGEFRGRGYSEVTSMLPDYLNDLNAMHEAEKTLTPEQAVRFRIGLSRNSDGRNASFPSAEAAMCHATARQRAMEFLWTLKESKD